MLREHEELKCDLLIAPDDEVLLRMKGVHEYFLDQQKPMKFNPHDRESVLLYNESKFEEVCNVMEDNGSANPKMLTEYSFYEKLRFYEKKYKSMKGAAEGQ